MRPKSVLKNFKKGQTKINLVLCITSMHLLILSHFMQNCIKSPSQKMELFISTDEVYRQKMFLEKVYNYN